jgi:2'-5' RNA ligase
MGDGRSTIVIPVPEADPVIGGYRLRYDPPARRGMPAHVTLLYPFLPPDALDAEIATRLRRVFAATPAFSFLLAGTAEFARGVLFLQPEPPAPFVALTRALSAEFGVVPYEGHIAEPQPHCTVAQEADELMRREIEIKLGPALPIQSHAREAWLMVRDEESPWQIRDRFRLR